MRFPLSAVAISSAIHRREIRARDVVADTLERLGTGDTILNCFTTVVTELAFADADAIDRAIDSGRDPGPLAGVPFAVKNLYSVAGFPTLAGAKINKGKPPAVRDAAAIRSLKAAGAILVGMLNMDEYAFGWTTENSHYGGTRNPRDPTRTPGGSSGASAAAVAAGFVPLALGSDTNGSIRLPAAFCGVFGLKPTFGRVSRSGTVLLASSLDHVGPIAGCVLDLATAYDVLQGWDPDDPVSSSTDVDPTVPGIGRDVKNLRVAVVAEEFGDAVPEAWSAVETIAITLDTRQRIRLPETDRARAAAALITASEAAAFHLEDLQRRPGDFDPLTRDRLLASALLPATAYIQAQRFRAWYRSEILRLFHDIDVLVTPTAPCLPPVLGPSGVDAATRLRLGPFTQPFSLIGLPAISLPVKTSSPLPLGVQLVAAPFRERVLLDLAAHLEMNGLLMSSSSSPPEQATHSSTEWLCDQGPI